MVTCFEGVGHLCEFGIVESFSGIEPISLLRFSSLPHTKFLELLRSDFDKLDDSAEIDLFIGPGHEWKVRIARYEMEFHTRKGVEDISRQDLLPKIIRHTAFLKRKFIEQLKQTDRIFVRRDVESSPEELRDLHDLMRKRAPHRLLWIDHTNDPSRIGAVEWVQTGLLRAHYGYFWPDAAPTPGGLGIWLRILEAGLRALHPDAWRLIAKHLAGENTSIDDGLPNLGWYASRFSTARQETAIAPLHPGIPVVKHTLDRDMSPDDGPIFCCDSPGLQAGRIYVVSAWVWVPAEFTGWIGMAFPGTAWLRMWSVDLTKRDAWQRIVTSTRVDRTTSRHPGLLVKAAAGEMFFSTGWCLERGCVPADCLALPRDVA